MVETVSNQNISTLSESHRRVQAFRWMLLARTLDDKLSNLYRAGKVHGGVFLGRGQEALSTSIGMALTKGDVFAPLIRDLGGRLAFGEPILDSLRTYLGSALGPMRGRDGNIHRGRPLEGLIPMISHLGSVISVVNGILMARNLKGITGHIGATCIGDGGTSTGAFHEGINQASIEKLPIVVVVADNQYAYSTHNSRQYACQTLLDRAVGYGVQGHELDGTDLFACLETLQKAATLARSGKGPQLVVAHLLRLCGHGEHDDAGYINPQLRQMPLGRDCLVVAESQLTSNNLASARSIATWRSQAQSQVEEALAIVQREPGPDPYKEDWSALNTRSFLEPREHYY